ncbi:MAG TPA: tripartite tricarboxylate transporter substrate binding protein, partial [Tepidisphaeraceae bacterium]|nr:tripartite tricarboxylate transporter substrate binding protein [Tepidisphaeraceae bacterium]
SALTFIYVAGPSWSQSYPTKPIRLIVGYAAGGSVDTTARIFAPRLSTELGQQVIVENRPGAASNIAAEYVAKSAPDGYTLFWSSGAALGTNMAFYEKLTYNPHKDFTPIAMLVYQANGLVVNPSVPAKTTKELIALAKARPGELNYGTAGSGTSQHMTAELFSKMAGIKMTGVAYKGGAPALIDLIAGQIDLVFSPLPEVIPYIQAKRLRSIAVSGAQRSPALPDVPTVAETLPGFAFEGFIGIVGPAGMASDLVRRLNAVTNKVLQDPDVKKRLVDLGLGIAGTTPDQFAAHMREQSTLMIRIARDAGIKPLD